MLWLFKKIYLFFKPLDPDPKDPWIRIRNTTSEDAKFCVAELSKVSKLLETMVSFLWTQSQALSVIVPGAGHGEEG